MSDDPFGVPFAKLMRDRGLGDPETDTDDVQSPALPADYVARLRALELADGDGSRLVGVNALDCARLYLAFLTDREKVDD